MLHLGKTLLPPPRSKFSQALFSFKLSLKLTWTCLMSMPFGAYDPTLHIALILEKNYLIFLLATSILNFRKSHFMAYHTHSGFKGLPIVNPTCMSHHLVCRHWSITSISLLFMQMTLVWWWVETRDLLHLFKESIPTIGRPPLKITHYWQVRFRKEIVGTNTCWLLQQLLPTLH
jgi:hypothetical protein